MTKTVRSEELYNRTPKPPQLLALCLRYWLDFRLTGDTKPLHKANHRVIIPGDWSLALQFCAAFFAIELELFESAADVLERLGSYRTYYRANAPFFNGAFLFLQALAASRAGKERVAVKYFRLLSDYAQKTKPDPAYALMLGWLRSEGVNGDSVMPWSYYSRCFAQGGRSVFLFERVYRCLAAGDEISLTADSGGKLLLAFVNWSISQRSIDASGILDSYMGAILAAVDNNPQTLEAYYEAYPDKRLLAGICLKYISRRDYSETAYRFYHDAETKQLSVPLLQQTLMRAAFYNNREEVGRFTMERFLQAGFDESDEPLKAYVYHVMLTSKRMRDFIPLHADQILQFAIDALKDGHSGRHYNSIYKFFLENKEGQDATHTFKASQILLNDIFTYRVTADHPDIRHIWVIEKEKRDMRSYDVCDGEALVKASSEHFSYVCFSEGIKHIIDERIKVTKLVENADVGLYTRFYDKGHNQPEILIALARHFLSQDELSDESAGMLRSAVEVKGLSLAFRMQINARLGNFHYDRGESAQALAYYRDVDENYLNDKFIERMLTVFINTGEYQKAAWLVAKKAHCITDKVLFQALKKIAKAAPECAEHIAAAAYGLLLRSWYDKTLIDVVTGSYKGAQADWQELNKVLNELSAPDACLDEMILYNAIWIRQPNAEAQKVFARCYRDTPDHELVGMFVYFLSYEMLCNNMKPEYDTIGVLETIFRTFRDRILGYALSNMYVTHGVTTLHSDEVLARALGFMENDGFILPAFKRSQDKKLRTPYIEKYQAFTYKALPDKDVRLYYRANGETGYRSRQMEYLQFGIYYAIVPHFYGEKLRYYFSEEMPTGSITTKEQEVDNGQMYLDEVIEDQFYVINNALIYEHMFKYDKAEAIITDSLRDLRTVRAKLL